MRGLVVGMCALAAAVSGCAAMRNTPQQDYVWEMGKPCEGKGAGITRVLPDGRYYGYWHGSPTPWFAFQQCMQEQFAAHPYGEWARARQEPPAAPQQPVAAAPAAQPAAAGPPTWARGDEWTYRWTSPAGSGTFVWSVDREEAVDGVPYYVVKSGTTREILVRQSDFAIYLDRVSGRIETRNTPPAALIPSPVAAGAKWGFSYTRERPLDRATDDIALQCESTAETVTVPAGTFETVKATCLNTRTGSPFYEAWLSLAVKQMVRDRTYLTTGGVRERELTSYRVR